MQCDLHKTTFDTLAKIFTINIMGHVMQLGFQEIDFLVALARRREHLHITEAKWHQQYDVDFVAAIKRRVPTDSERHRASPQAQYNTPTMRTCKNPRTSFMNSMQDRHLFTDIGDERLPRSAERSFRSDLEKL